MPAWKEGQGLKCTLRPEASKGHRRASLLSSPFSPTLLLHAAPALRPLPPLQLAVTVTQGDKVVAPGTIPANPTAVAALLNRALLGNSYFSKVGGHLTLLLLLLLQLLLLLLLPESFHSCGIDDV